MSPALTDTERLDALDGLAAYGTGWVLRLSSTGRGLRLHETTREDAQPTVRAAIDAYLEELDSAVPVGGL